LIFQVSVNYRLGAFGWLAGDSFKSAADFQSAGFSDQVIALDWVEQNIGLFGSKPNEVNTMRESAGASSILHHLVSYAGGRYSDSGPTFQQTVLPSRALFPNVERPQTESSYQSFMKEANVKDFQELQMTKTADLIRENRKTSYESPCGQFTYRRVTDDTYVLAPPAWLLKHVSVLADRKVMVPYHLAEGLLFTPPWLHGQNALRKRIL
jgi:carboxylesterase type B